MIELEQSPICKLRSKLRSEKKSFLFRVAKNRTKNACFNSLEKINLLSFEINSVKIHGWWLIWLKPMLTSLIMIISSSHHGLLVAESISPPPIISPVSRIIRL
jgi:hypothetical protein